jgi:hypothetical protein
MRQCMFQPQTKKVPGTRRKRRGLIIHIYKSFVTILYYIYTLVVATSSKFLSLLYIYIYIIYCRPAAMSHVNSQLTLMPYHFFPKRFVFPLLPPLANKHMKKRTTLGRMQVCNCPSYQLGIRGSIRHRV